MSDYELQITLRGPERENERGYTNRETLANATLPVDPSRGWSIYLGAVDDAISPACEVVLEDD